MIRAKMRCWSVTPGTCKQDDGNGKWINGPCETVKFSAASGPENKDWNRATPSANLDMVIANPAAVGKFQAGKDYFLNFTPAS